MLKNSGSVNALCIIAAVTCILCYFFSSLSLWWLLLPLFVYVTVLSYGSANIQTGFFIKTYCSSNTQEKIIAISFDDGPHREFTPEILKTLSEYNVPATFFVIGKNIRGNEKLIQQMDKSGHILGNHTFSHSFFIDFKGKLGFMFELDATSDLIHEIIGKRTKYFRPPYGVTTPALAAASEALDYSIIGWNIRSLDTTGKTEKEIADRVTSRIKPGSIILFHDTSAKTIGVLKQTLNFAKENGFKIVSTEELLKIQAYA